MPPPPEAPAAVRASATSAPVIPAPMTTTSAFAGGGAIVPSSRNPSATSQNGAPEWSLTVRYSSCYGIRCERRPALIHPIHGLDVTDFAVVVQELIDPKGAARPSRPVPLGSRLHVPLVAGVLTQTSLFAL